MGWNYFSILKLQRLEWIRNFIPHFIDMIRCDYLPMLSLMSIRVSKRGPRLMCEDTCSHRVYTSYTQLWCFSSVLVSPLQWLIWVWLKHIYIYIYIWVNWAPRIMAMAYCLLLWPMLTSVRFLHRNKLGIDVNRKLTFSMNKNYGNFLFIR